MQPSQKFAMDIGITFILYAISIPMGFIISICHKYLLQGKRIVFQESLFEFGRLDISPET
jgi:hypothetical protein